jgi:hypothetical protein
MADKSKLGYEFPALSFVVEKGKIAEFAMAVAQKDSKDKIKPIYSDAEAARKAGYPGIVIPPTLQTCLMFWTGGGLMDIVQTLGINLGRLLHAEEDYEYFGNICEGDILSGRMKVVEMYNKEKKGRPGRSMEFIILETEVKNQRGELVLKDRSTLVER